MRKVSMPSCSGQRMSCVRSDPSDASFPQLRLFPTAAWMSTHRLTSPIIPKIAQDAVEAAESEPEYSHDRQIELPVRHLHILPDDKEEDSEKMMKELNTDTTISVYDVNFDRQAMNLSTSHLSEAVRPWFEDWNDVSIRRAIDDLDVPALREQAAEYLGLELQIAA